MKPKTEKQIRSWMTGHKKDFLDYTTNLTNLTLLVEAWDSEQSTGESTTDPSHIAWEIAAKLCEKEELT